MKKNRYSEGIDKFLLYKKEQSIGGEEMQKLRFDFTLSVIMILIVGFGIVMNYSASSILSLEYYGHLNYFLIRHLTFVFIGIVLIVIMTKIKYQKVRPFIIIINVVTIILLLLSYVPAFQVNVNGADRWLNLFGLQFQPSELVKLTVIITVSHMIDVRFRKGTLNKVFDLKNGFLAIVGYIAIYAVLVLMQKHLSATGLILIITMGLLFTARLNKIYFVMLGGVVAAAGVIGVLLEPFRMKRIMSFMDPEKDALGDGYQVIQSWYGLGSGSLNGLGLGMSRQKFGPWLPENHTDFIIGVIGEELGWVGILIVIVLFVLFAMRAYTLAMGATDYFGMLLITGVTIWMTAQFAINMAVVSGLFPVTGVPLPFISYGGTSTTILFAGVGIIYSVVSQIKEKEYQEAMLEKEQERAEV